MSKYFSIVILSLLSLCLSGSKCQTGTKKLTDGGQPRFNSTGAQIAYTYQGKIWVMDVGGKNKQQVGNFENENYPSWSPDDMKIIFQCYGENRPSGKDFLLYLMNSDGTESHPLLNSAVSPENDQLPLWSPDGKQVVFTHGKRLWIVDYSGQNAHPLTPDPAKEWEFVGDWSPDGKYIAYVRVDSYNDSISPPSKIWLIRPNGEGQKLFLDGIRATDVRWSNDGQYLYYSTFSEIWKIDIEGANLPEKIFETEFISSWDISPNEQWILFDNAEANIKSSIFITPIVDNH